MARHVSTLLLALAVACIFGGEGWCLAGARTAAVHESCHRILYTGFVLVVLGGGVHLWNVIRNR